MEDSDELSPSDDVKMISVPFQPQKYNWDCGLACSCMVLRFLDKNCDTVYSSDLKLLQCGESVWTIHLALLMKLHDVRHCFSTVTLGVDKNYANESYYKNRFNEDERLVNELFENAEEKGICVERRSVELAEILNHVSDGNILICLIDYSVLACVNCFTESCTLLKCFGNCIHCYQGHFIVVCGYDKSKQLIYFMNPNISHAEIGSCTMKEFDVARKRYGTDEDLLFIYKD